FPEDSGDGLDRFRKGNGVRCPRAVCEADQHLLDVPCGLSFRVVTVVFSLTAPHHVALRPVRPGLWATLWYRLRPPWPEVLKGHPTLRAPLIKEAFGFYL